MGCFLALIGLLVPMAMKSFESNMIPIIHFQWWNILPGGLDNTITSGLDFRKVHKRPHAPQMVYKWALAGLLVTVDMGCFESDVIPIVHFPW